MKENRVFVSDKGQTEYSFEDGITCSRMKVLDIWPSNNSLYRMITCLNIDTNEKCNMFLSNALFPSLTKDIWKKEFYIQHSIKNNFIITMIRLNTDE